MSIRKRRPWYVSDELCDDYLAVAIAISRSELEMLQALKVIRGLSLNIIIAVITIFPVMQGGNPELLGATGLVALALVNGVEAVDFLAAQQALREAKHARNPDDD